MRFSDIIGQDEAVAQMREAIDRERLPHALMLTGPDGVGKLALANALAQYRNCLQPQDGDSCGRCANCLKISKGIHPDVNYLLPIISKTEGGKRYLTADYFESFKAGFFQDPYYSFGEWTRSLGGENKQLFISVHEIRDLKRRIYLKAFEAPYKVVIIWNAERINSEGANAFLKLLEEPPDRTQIIMTCSVPSQLLTTINSRCQRVRLGRIAPKAIEDYLVTRQGVEPARAQELAAIAEGSIGNAKEALTEGSVALTRTYIEWLRAAYVGDYDKISQQIELIYKESKEVQKLFLQAALKKVRDSLLYQCGLPDLALVTEEEKGFQEKFSQIMTPDKVERMTQEIENSHRQIAGNANAQMAFTALSLRLHGILRG
jgi:DNA polymerase III subunit delta'